jgi:hypothetical protein
MTYDREFHDHVTFMSVESVTKTLFQKCDINLHYFSKEKFLTKNHLVQQFTGDNKLAKYWPDEINPSTVAPAFLFALLFNV